MPDHYIKKLLKLQEDTQFSRRPKTKSRASPTGEVIK